jgi:hypothetical protein
MHKIAFQMMCFIQQMQNWQVFIWGDYNDGELFHNY